MNTKNMIENQQKKELKINFWNLRSLNFMTKKSYLQANNPHIVALNENYYVPNFKRFENYVTEKFNGRSYASLSIKREIQMEIFKNENDFIIGHVKIAEGSAFIGSIYLNPGDKERRQATINSLENCIKEI